MTVKKVDYLIIGNGIAGLSAATEIRKHDKYGSIAMISRESYFTYYRIKLGKYLYKDFDDEELLVNKESWYKEQNINVVLNKIVEYIDFEKCLVKLDDGVQIGYDKLLLAMGSRPFIPPIRGKFKKGVFALRTVDDLKYIKEYFSKCESISVIGGGLLGLEAAWSIKKLNKKVNIIHRSPHLLSRQLDEETSKKLERKLEKAGFNIYLGSEPKEILGKNVANGIKLSNGKEIKTDAILVSSGVRSNLDLVIDTEIQYNRGIKVDKYLRTNIPNVYAAGDVAEVEGIVFGLWVTANQQGKIAGKNMVGNLEEYVPPKPYTTLQIGDIKLFSVGNVKEYDDSYTYKIESGDIFRKLFVTNGKITGGILLDDMKEMGKLKNAVMDNTRLKDYTKTL